MQSSYSIELVQRSNTSRGIYPKAALMTVFAQHPAAFIQGRLLSRPQLLTGKLRYVQVRVCISLSMCLCM